MLFVSLPCVVPVSPPHCHVLSPYPHRASSRVKAVSQSSGCYDSDSAELYPTDETADGHHYQGRGVDGGFERPGVARSSGLRRQAIQNWHRRPYRNSTEGEEGDISDVGSRTTESEAEVWEQEPRLPTEAQQANASRPVSSCRLMGEAGFGGARREPISPQTAAAFETNELSVTSNEMGNWIWETQTTLV